MDWGLLGLEWARGSLLTHSTLLLICFIRLCFIFLAALVNQVEYDTLRCKEMTFSLFHWATFISVTFKDAAPAFKKINCMSVTVTFS
jgi:hypoxanthine-guanine phosphoribosyltransferase